jgi:hypothetical protein
MVIHAPPPILIYCASPSALSHQQSHTPDKVQKHKGELYLLSKNSPDASIKNHYKITAEY